MAWSEIDFDTKVWTVPADRMKAGRLHRVPLSDRAIKILNSLRPAPADTATDYVFPGGKPNRPLSAMAMQMVLRRTQVGKLATVHGFRSAFRDWAADETVFPREIAEAALAHTIGDATERAYRRGDALERRRELMSAWATYVNGE